MNVSEFYEVVKLALLVVTISGAVAAAVVELVKAFVRCFGNYSIPGNIMSLVSGLMAAATTAYFLGGAGVGLVPAILAAVVAVFAPSVAHDLLRRNT